jgi:hypothetical protein
MKTKKNMKNRITVLTCVLALITAGTPQCFASDDPGAIVADALLVRPACLLTTIIGSALFVICLPVAAASKSVHKTARALVVKPAQATFTRPLGNLAELGDQSTD